MKIKLSWFDRIMAAVTFAEANEHMKGKSFLTTPAEGQEKKNCRECEPILAADLHGAEAQS